MSSDLTIIWILISPSLYVLRFNHNLDSHFTISVWMKHKRNPHEKKHHGEKEHILCNSDGEGESSAPRDHRHTHNPRTNARRPCLINVITNLPYSFQRVEGKSGFFTMPIHIATHRGQSSMNIEWISEVYQHNQPRPADISLGTVGTTML